MTILSKTRQILYKLYNLVKSVRHLRLLDRRFYKKANTTYLVVNPEAAQLHHAPITVRYDKEKNTMEYNIHTAASMRVMNPKDIVKINNPM